MSESILQEAERIINGARSKAYGCVLESHRRIGELWSAYLGCDVSPADVAMMMVLLKVSREKSSRHRDNLVDIAGYAGCAESIYGKLDGEAERKQEEVRLTSDVEGRDAILVGSGS